MDESLPPKKPRAYKRKAKKEAEVTSEVTTVEDAELAAPEKAQVEKLIKQALFRHGVQVEMDSKDKHKETSHLANIMSEYLDPFIMIGYNFQGEQTVAFYAKNSRDEAALVDLLRSTFVDIVSNRP